MEFAVDGSKRRRFSLQKDAWRDKWTVQKRRRGWFEHLPSGWWVKLFLSKARGSRSSASSIMHGQDKDCTGGFQRRGAVTQSHPIQLQPAERMMPLAPLFSTCNLSNNHRQQVNGLRTDRRLICKYKERRPLHWAPEKLLVPGMDAAGGHTRMLLLLLPLQELVVLETEVRLYFSPKYSLEKHRENV